MPVRDADILDALQHLTTAGHAQASAPDIAKRAGLSESTARRALSRLIASGQVTATGRARFTRYALSPAHVIAPARGVREETGPLPAASIIPWSPAAIALRRKLAAPLAARQPVAYRRELLDDYVPGVSSLLPPTLAADLLREGRLPDQQPAGTYARKVLEQLLVELSWSSSKLEGNTYSLLDTERLFKQGASGMDHDAVMLLNHKHAIEFLVEEGLRRGLTTSVLRNVHSLLMDGLMPEEYLGAIRSTPVYITGTTFVPLQAPQVLDELFDTLVAKARLIPNPIESAYFLWVHVAYLQPFVDGNKRTSRIAANVPLTLYNCSPLAFMDVDRNDYAQAMMGIYEFNDFSAATDLFAWTYRRSIRRYEAVIQSTQGPDPFAVRFREALTSAIGMIVDQGATMDLAVQNQRLSNDDADRFRRLLDERLDAMQPYNSARYRLSEERTRAWIDAGRPR